MTIQLDSHLARPAQPRLGPTGVADSLKELVVADAPPDYDEVVASVPVAPGWVRVMVVLLAALGSWALVFAAVRMLGR
jgi:hypothetical protein